MLEEILRLAKKEAQVVEVYYHQNQQTPVNFEAGRLKSIESKQSEIWALRIVRHGREGFAVVAGEMDKHDLVSMAVECSQFGQEVAYQLPGNNSSLPSVTTFDSHAAQYPNELMVQKCQELCDYIKSLHTDLIAEAQMEKSCGKIVLANSEGLEVSCEHSHLSIEAAGTLVRGTDMLFLGSGDNSVGQDLDLEFIKSELNRQFRWASQGNIEIKNGMMPIIFTPEGFASAFLPSLLSALNGKTVLMGASPLADKLEQTIFDRRFSLCDAQTANLRPASRPFDGEGTASRNLELCQNGVLKNFVYDRKTAWQAGKTSTGNAIRAGGAPQLSFTNLVCPNGHVTFDQMVANLKDGLIVESLLGAGQGNTLSGEFSGNVLLGYKVENGEIVGRVKDVMISGNTFTLLKEIGEIGNDRRFYHNFCIPSFTFPQVYVATN